MSDDASKDLAKLEADRASGKMRKRKIRPEDEIARRSLYPPERALCDWLIQQASISGAVFADGWNAGCTMQMTAATALEDNQSSQYGVGIAASWKALLYLKELKARRNHADIAGGAIATLLDDTGFTPSLTVFNRDDGIDNDGDGFIDFPSDPACMTVSFPRENARCQGGLEDEGDGLVDFDGGASRNGGVPLIAPIPSASPNRGATRRLPAAGSAQSWHS